MAGPTYSREEIELRLKAYELTEREFALKERKFALWEKAVLLFVTVASAAVATYCAMHGYRWEISTLTGSPGAASSIALGLQAHRKRSDGPSSSQPY